MSNHPRVLEKEKPNGRRRALIALGVVGVCVAVVYYLLWDSGVSDHPALPAYFGASVISPVTPNADSAAEANAESFSSDAATETSDEITLVVSGRVVDEFGEAVAFASVVAKPSSDSTSSYEMPIRAKCDAAGKFAFVDLKPGEYVLVPSKHGFVVERPVLFEWRDGMRALAIDDAVMVRVAGYIGHVFDERSQPVEGAVVAVDRGAETDAGSSVPIRALTDATGRFQCLNVSSVPSNLTVRHPEFATYALEFSDASALPESITLVRAAGLEVMAVAADGSPFSGFASLLFSNAGIGERHGTFGLDGKVYFGNLEAGGCYVAMAVAGHPATQAQPVVLTNGHTTAIKMRVPPSQVDVVVEVFDESENPIAGATVSVWQFPSESERVGAVAGKSDRDGVLKLTNVDWRRSRLQVSAPGCISKYVELRARPGNRKLQVILEAQPTATPAEASQ
ncbi:MAG: carboxypeptidase regulatory-like domain-containing protein [Planctomycetota bacterium]